MPTGMEFEGTLRLLLGRRAQHTASASENPRRRAEWIRKAISKLEHEVIALDTTERHRQMMLGDLAAAKDEVAAAEQRSWSLVYRLLRLASRLFGYDFARGAKCHTATYWQSPKQNLNTAVPLGAA